MQCEANTLNSTHPDKLESRACCAASQHHRAASKASYKVDHRSPSTSAIEPARSRVDAVARLKTEAGQSDRDGLSLMSAVMEEVPR